MFRKICFSNFFRISSNYCQIRCFCSQIVKTKDIELNKIEKQKTIKTFTEISDQNNDRKQLTERQQQELTQIIKTPVQMDSYWETNLDDKPLQKRSFLDEKGGFSTEVYAALHHKFDFSIPGIKRRLKYQIDFRENFNQRYIRKRHGVLGPELATAHFVVYRGGMVRFKHEPNIWVKDYKKLVTKYDPRYRVIALDASNIKLRYEAFDNFILLDSLQELNLSKNKLLDDFVCDKIGRLFRNSKTLSVLDLSDNPLITHRGIETLHRIRSLKRLVISGTKAAKYPFIDLLILLFNDVNPDCHIII